MRTSTRRRAERTPPGRGYAADSEPHGKGGGTLDPFRGTLVSRTAALPPKVTRAGASIQVVCGCGLFSLTFCSVKAARLGHFRCLICGWTQPLAALLGRDGPSDSLGKPEAQS